MFDTSVEFRQIHDTYRPKILRYLTQFVGKHEAEDLTQNVFLKVSEGLKNFRGEASLSTWIYRIATNAAFDRLRSRSGRAAKMVPSPSAPTSLEKADKDKPDTSSDQKTPPLESEAIRMEMNACIKQFIDDLPENSRVVIVLSDIEGFQNNEIADILNVSLDTVKIRLHRARQQLKKRLEAGCDFYRDGQMEFACDRKSDVTPSAK